MRVLYIGGTGEISYACVQRSVALGHDVTVFNRGRRNEPLPPGVRQIAGDRTVEADYRPLAEEHFDVVCQFTLYDPNAIAREIEIFGGQCGQYVFISTASAYQKPPASAIITEQTPLENPFWQYSRDKIDMERQLLEAHAEGCLAVTIVRPSHTWRRRFPGMFASGDDWAWRIRQGKPIILFGDGTTLWTYTHADDFAVPFCGLFGQSAALGEAFHITDHLLAYTWRQIWQAAAAALERELSAVAVPTDTLVRFNSDWSGPLLGDKTWCAIFDNRKVFSVAGEHRPSVSLADGFARVAEGYRQREADVMPNTQLHALLDRIIESQQGVQL